MSTSTSVQLLGVTDSTSDPTYGVALRATASAFMEALNVFEDAGKMDRKDWKLKTEIKGDKCYNKHFSIGKVYTLKKEYPLTPQVLFQQHWDEIEKTPEWNPNVQSVKRECVISEQADILHYATSDVVVVKGRDFVVCRMWRRHGDHIIVAASSFQNNVPVVPKKKRGWVNLCAGRFEGHPTDANRTIVTYLVSVDFRDKLLPKTVVSSGIAEMTIKDARYALKKVEEELAKEKKQ